MDPRDSHAVASLIALRGPLTRWLGRAAENPHRESTEPRKLHFSLGNQ